MDKPYMLNMMDMISTSNETELFEFAGDTYASDEFRLAAALLLCTCDSNERKAGE